jgi:hypothetical protein
MNWKLIFLLSMFGLFMAFATVFFIPSNIEPVCWLIIFLICAYLIAKNAPGQYFLHGLYTSLLNCVWITGVHVLLFTQYAANHVQEIENSAKFPILAGHPHKQMVIIGPMIGIISGLVLGLFSFIASKIVKKKPATQA